MTFTMSEVAFQTPSLVAGTKLAGEFAYQAAKFGVPMAAAAGIVAYNAICSDSQFLPRAEGTIGERLRRDEPVSSHGRLRLRRRGRWEHAFVRSLGLRQGYLGAVLSGRWRPDLSGEGADLDVADWLSAFLADGAKVVGGGFCELDDPDADDVPYVRVILGDREVNLLPGLVARLSLYSCYRKRSAALLSALRTRAVEWMREKRISDYFASLCLPGTLSLAFVKGGEEEAGEGILSSVAARESMGENWFGLRGYNPWIDTGRALVTE